MRKALSVILALMVTGINPVAVAAQVYTSTDKIVSPISNSQVDDTTGAGKIIAILAYYGDAEFAEIDVDTTLDFSTGTTTTPDAAEAGDEVDAGAVCGSETRSLAITGDADCNLWGEFIGVINSSAVWRAALVGVRPEDTVVLADMVDPADAAFAPVANSGSSARIYVLRGIAASDGTKSFGVSLYPGLARVGATDMRAFYGDRSQNAVGHKGRVCVSYVSAIVDIDASTTANVQVYSVDQAGSRSYLVYQTGNLTDDTRSNTDLSNYPVCGLEGDRLLVLVQGVGTNGIDTVVDLHLAGFYVE